MNNRRSFIVGINSTKLSSKEKFFLKAYKPWGVILFTRNIKNINQTFSLTSSIRKIFNDKKYPILIDQEGGRVNRLKNIITFENLNSEYFGKKYLKNINEFKFFYKLFIDKSYIIFCVPYNGLFKKLCIDISLFDIVSISKSKLENVYEISPLLL